MRQGRAAGLAGLAAVLLVAAGRAQVQQEPWAETRDGTGINITCSHPNIQSSEVIHWYRHLPGRGPAFVVLGTKGSKALTDLAGWLVVAADRRSSALWLAQPRLRDAAVYYCALRATGRGAGAAAGQEPWRAGPGVCGGGEAGAQHPGGAAALPAGAALPLAAPGGPPPAKPQPWLGPAEAPQFSRVRRWGSDVGRTQLGVRGQDGTPSNVDVGQGKGHT
ncbi:uncharacterized protein LOC118258219 [Cygnus atratus]|uniref:uncharacterized protein LOC118258219 n=1 Tax=Cygnus atratus TaxID=8868 RepID=UPI0015D58B53|nr:uncharacterized protein LOC118258219 [Cygnus atratus]